MSRVEYIIDFIEKENPIHAKKLKKVFKKQGAEFRKDANQFYEKYNEFAQTLGKSFTFGIESYLRTLSDVTLEYLHFIKTGEYSNNSFEEVNKNVYNNPEIMEYHMHGLLFSQYLWPQHTDIFHFFKKHTSSYKSSVKKYLEIGAGHGMYLSEAMNAFGKEVSFEVVDLSPTSIELAKNFIKNDKVTYLLKDIFDYKPEVNFDFITMGEVLEHVEDPVALLRRVKEMLTPNGCLFMTTPANAPAIDHIYLFNNADDIRKVIEKAGFEIEYEYTKYVEDVPKEFAEKHKITLMYGAYLRMKK